MQVVKKFVIFILNKISRIIFHIVPDEFKPLKPGKKLLIKLEDNLIDETITHFLEHYKKSLLFEDPVKIREYAIQTSLSNDKNKEYYYLEFGVADGHSANFFSKFVNKFYCFDSLEGLREDWFGTFGELRESYTQNKKIPKLHSNNELVIGWVEDTLDDFLKKNNPKINFVHFDMDNYSSTKFALEKIKPYLNKNAILIFDQFTGYLGWKNGEYRAFKEVFKDEEFKYLAFSIRDIGYNKSVIQIK